MNTIITAEKWQSVPGRRWPSCNKTKLTLAADVIASSCHQGDWLRLSLHYSRGTVGEMVI
jgi:hypothetical protein